MPEITPFGKEWKHDIMKRSKADIVLLYKTTCLKLQAKEFQIQNNPFCDNCLENQKIEYNCAVTLDGTCEMTREYQRMKKEKHRAPHPDCYMFGGRGCNNINLDGEKVSFKKQPDSSAVELVKRLNYVLIIMEDNKLIKIKYKDSSLNQDVNNLLQHPGLQSADKPEGEVCSSCRGTTRELYGIKGTCKRCKGTGKLTSSG